jgi:hypothetical protein
MHLDLSLNQSVKNSIFLTDIKFRVCLICVICIEKDEFVANLMVITTLVFDVILSMD